MWMVVYGVCVECIGSIGNSGELVCANVSAVLWFLGVLLYSLRFYGFWLRGVFNSWTEKKSKKKTSKRGKSFSSPPKNT